MFTIILSALLLLVGIGFLVAGIRLYRKDKEPETLKSSKTNRTSGSNDEDGQLTWEAALGVSIIDFAVMILLLLWEGFVIIPAGHVGVVDVFGVVEETTLKSGINFVKPWASVEKMVIKTQEIKETMDVPSKEGLSVHLEISALYHLDPDKASQVYRTVGSNYVDVIVTPQFRSVTRGVTASYDAKALYTSDRELLAKQVMDELEHLIGPRGIILESTPLRSVGLPPGLAMSIEAKLQAEQQSQQMQFVLTKEKQEADRKRIEAGGIADFQAIVSKGITESLLRWKGIEATEKISQSPNTKVVIIGSGKDGLPLIMDTK